MELAQFVLQSQILPGGRMPLRVFEPRYLRMIADATGGRRQFGICMPSPSNQTHHLSGLCQVGTLVEVVDFETLADGRLGITVEGRQRYQIKDSYQENDKLHVATVSLLPNWPHCPLPDDAINLQQLLMQIFEEHPELAELYPSPQFDDAAWLSARWLEILPLSGPDKLPFIEHPDCEKALHYLCYQLASSRLSS
ncbi:LON peptidase substrate-binding domain-containing protein [Gallaecimonas mangrovi]|uniref:LON peptidase substrate-binding domain-containing protein n=1 Tax=Gallaecimonas mangrovi TaxID=2291597 RepID=UPI000E1FF4CC|nr:LON peptidase substrate-binding domain-containing protein [Gallaecimonas mangrovi]